MSSGHPAERSFQMEQRDGEQDFPECNQGSNAVGR